MNDQETSNGPFAAQQEAIREAGQAMKASLLQQMQDKGVRPRYNENVSAFADTIRQQVNGFVTSLTSTIQEQVNGFVQDAQDREDAER